MAQSRSINGKVAIVTGGTGGVGNALAKALVREGARVAICDLDPDLVEKAVIELNAMGGSDAIGTAVDLSDREAYSTFLEEVEEKLGPIDILVNNAAIMPVGPFEDETEATAARQVDVNFHAVLHGTKEALKRMKPRGSGHIVNVASGAGWVPGAGGVTYSATKFAVNGMTQALDLELHGSGVDVSIVAPGVIKTQLSSGIKEVKGLKPVTPDEVAAAVVDGLKNPRFAIFVPKAMGLMAHVYSILPYKVRGAMARATGSDKLLLNVDKQARAEYEAKVGVAENAPV
jgi:NAD(P)-dependent dehydrogenase (short-subunit alcohol dehydrogenase family)